MKEFLKEIYRKILSILPEKMALSIDYMRGYHKIMNFKEPKYFGEKINYLKVYGDMEQYKNYVDKYEVRKYIKDTIGEEYLIPLLAVYIKINDIEYNNLPNRFVIKLNYGSGFNYIVQNKEQVNFDKINRKLKKWLKCDYHKIKKEKQYKDIEKKILIEKFMSDRNGCLNDYKFFCFNGKMKFFKVDFDRYSSHKCNYYDQDCNFLNIREAKYKNNENSVVLPKNIREMCRIAERLARKFPFVRVDLYNINGRIYFGELTFTPAAGMHPFKPLSADLEIASLIDIKKEKN